MVPPQESMDTVGKDFFTSKGLLEILGSEYFFITSILLTFFLSRPIL